MNEPIQLALTQIFIQCGPAVMDDPRRVVALLKDLVPGHIAECRVMAAALEDRLPQKMLRDDCSGHLAEVVNRRYAEALAKNTLLAPDVTIQAVRTISAALAGWSACPKSLPAGISPTPAGATKHSTASLNDAVSQMPCVFISDLAIELRPIPVGSFVMGSPESEEGRGMDEYQHQVRFTQGFYLGRTPVTQAQWRALMGGRRGYFKGDSLPVESVSWTDARSFCRRLTERERLAGRLPEHLEYTLPTEAQWEYACRAGTAQSGAGEIDACAWYRENAGGMTHAVGTKSPNAWGLYDMHGNVREWCRGVHSAYPKGAVSYPGDSPTGERFGRAIFERAIRVFRGGSWCDEPWACRAAYRGRSPQDFHDFNLGFRLCLDSTE